MHCNGSPAEFIQAARGDIGPHGAHEFDEVLCLGAPAGFEADCGRAGPHGRHRIDFEPEEATR